MIYYILICLIFMILSEWSGKIEFYKMRANKKSLKAIVKEYRNEKSPMRNDYTQIPYPYVIIEGGNLILIKVKYSNGNIIKPFKIGERIDVFWYGGILYYWYAYDRGISKYLSSRWDFWNGDNPRKWGLSEKFF